MAEDRRSPLELLEALTVQEVEIAPDLRHLEIYTMRGLLTLLVARPRRRARTCSSRAAAGWAACSVRPKASTTTSASRSRRAASARCASATASRTTSALRARRGGGGRPRGPARRAAVRHDGPLVRRRGRDPGRRGARRRTAAGVVTLATQSAGCEDAAELGDTPLLLLHGTHDEILPPETSSIVQMLAGHGEVVLLPGAGHLLSEAADELRERIDAWIGERFADA